MTEEVQPGTNPEQKEPGRLIYVYRNGDRFKNYKRYVVNKKTVRSLDYLFNELTKLLEPSFGAVRNLRTPTQGHVVNTLDEIEGGRSYVAGGHGRFIRLPYEKARSLSEFNVPGKIKRSAEPYGAPKPVLIKPVKHSRIVASGKVKKDPGDSFFVHIYVNGDDISPAIKVRLVVGERTSMPAALNAIGKKVRTMTGAVLRIHTVDGERVRSVEELQNGEHYVAVGREKQFRPVQYGKHSLPVWHPGKHIASLSPTNTTDKISESSSSHAAATGGSQEHASRRPADGNSGPAGSRLSNPQNANPGGSTASLHEKEAGHTTKEHAEKETKSKNDPHPPPGAKGRTKKDKAEDENEQSPVTTPRNDSGKKGHDNQGTDNAHKTDPKKQQQQQQAKSNNDGAKDNVFVSQSEPVASKEHTRTGQDIHKENSTVHHDQSKKQHDQSLNPDKKENNMPSRSGTRVVQEEGESQHAAQPHHSGDNNADASKP